MLFRARAVLERLAPTPPRRADRRLSRHDTAPLDLDLAEAAALDLARNGKRASGRMPTLLLAGRPPGCPGRGAELERPTATSTGGCAGCRPTPVGTPDRSIRAHPGAARRRRFRRSRGPDQRQAAAALAARRAKSGERPKRRRRFLRPGRIIALILILASLAAGLIGWQLAGRQVAVPKVLGKSPAAAQAAVHKAHLSRAARRRRCTARRCRKGRRGCRPRRPAAGSPAAPGDARRSRSVRSATPCRPC